MEKKKDIEHWRKMFFSITDDEARARAKQAEQKRKRIEEKRSDTGL